jgi:hypothetical protein
VGMEQSVQRGVTPGPIAWSLAAGFLAWGIDLSFSYVLQRHACSARSPLMLHVITWVCFAIAISGVIPGVIGFRSLPHDSSEEGGGPDDRAHFQAVLGIAFSIAFAVVVIAAALPRWLLDPCG